MKGQQGRMLALHCLQDQGEYRQDSGHGHDKVDECFTAGHHITAIHSRMAINPTTAMKVPNPLPLPLLPCRNGGMSVGLPMSLLS